ncbi:MAG: hypothetical protein B7Y25_01945 [Alphaproteobacteria bacterium 16-39-46]|nr:MAG: hypothetical protein B7Y25_01945 [Alphaproteobacteria bacterium 16-39-46]OZA43740.1 MAG: hypothetical protein B7X84_02195 [Alphaproteobacteria bacterium 17-39-52]HQS83556.1 hypothetical protein [Alphaproteobacteria bacterium]HQS93345.1 hypothetical protein [Alphaproteobacteria bacterium]
MNRFKKLFLSLAYVFAILICPEVWGLEEERELKEKFCFLPAKYPHFVDEANKAYTDPTEEIHRETLKKMGEGTQDDFCRNLFALLESPVNVPVFYRNSEDLAARVLEKEERLWNDVVAQEDLFYRQFRGLKEKRERSFAQDIALAAIQIDHEISKIKLAKDENPTVLFLGRTPCFIQVALEELYKLCKGDIDPNCFIQLNYSGHVDCESARDENFYKKYPERQIWRNMPSPEKIAFYFDYMTRKNLSRATHLIIVDTIGSGGSLNSFYNLLGNYYQWARRPMPSLHFFALTSLVDMNEYVPSRRLWTFEKRVAGKFQISFKSNPELNMKDFSIPTVPIHCSNTTLSNVLDNDFIQYFGTHGVEFPAQKWRRDYLKEMERGGIYHNALYEILRPLLKLSLIDMIGSLTV